MDVASYSSYSCSGFANVNLTQEMLGEESRQKILGKKQDTEDKLKKERENNLDILERYKDDLLRNM